MQEAFSGSKRSSRRNKGYKRRFCYEMQRGTRLRKRSLEKTVRAKKAEDTPENGCAYRKLKGGRKYRWTMT